jgi:hypothetical protein
MKVEKCKVMNLYNLELSDIKDKKVSLNQYSGKVLLIIITATEWKYLYYFEGFQKLYQSNILMTPDSSISILLMKPNSPPPLKNTLSKSFLTINHE